jgi:hypothetical protein
MSVSTLTRPTRTSTWAGVRPSPSRRSRRAPACSRPGQTDSHIGTPPLTSLLLRNLYPLRPLIIPSSPESESPLSLPATRATPNTSAQLLVADGRLAGGEPGPPVGGPRVASPLSESFWAHVERPPFSPWLGGGGIVLHRAYHMRLIWPFDQWSTVQILAGLWGAPRTGPRTRRRGRGGRRRAAAPRRRAPARPPSPAAPCARASVGVMGRE